MLDRQKIEAILSRRFPGASYLQIAAAANGIMGLADEWEEVNGQEPMIRAGEEFEPGELRLFRRRATA